MRIHTTFVLALLLTFAAPLMADQLLTPEEQDFETVVDPGRWTVYTWPDTSSEPAKPPPMGSAGEHSTGNDVVISLASDAPVGSGTSCLQINWGGTIWDTGGVMITLDVVNGATYTISANLKFESSNAYNAAGGFSVDTDGGTNPAQAEFGIRDTTTLVTNPVDAEFDINRGGSDPPYLTGMWAWCATFAGSNAGQWWGPPEIEYDIAATGNQMTIFLWGSFKEDVEVKLDAVSVDGPIPTPVPPSTGVEGWDVYR
jgi:hypothetical protein